MSVRGNRKAKDQRVPKKIRTAARKLDFSGTDADCWVFAEVEFNGSYMFHKQPAQEEIAGSISDGLERIKAEPETWEGMWYQTDMKSWPEDQQRYQLVRRSPKSGFCVQAQEGAGFTWVQAKFQKLPADVEVDPDCFTDSANYQGYTLAPPKMPGRGQGVDDVPGLKIIGEVDPSDITQGNVGDCWLLSAISAMAEFDGPISHVFRSTPDLQDLPREGFNKYTITLFDLSTWEPKEVVVDERLCSKADGSGLLGCSPVMSGELWPCYLEKAVAAHCGGWDKIDGGEPTHAWRLLMGAKKQYTFQRCEDGWACCGVFNPNTQELEQLANSPHDGFQGKWENEWPEVGGGGEIGTKVDDNSMFERMCAWDDEDFIMCAGTRGGSDSESYQGIVGAHAYTVVECIDNAGGTDFDMVKVRNPWHTGEFQSGMWDDDGPGWEEYPQVKEACNPMHTNDGIFWMSKEEFFTYFSTVYLCAR